MKRTRTSKAWMREHVNDPYVQLARKEGWRSRAAFKLMEIDDKDKLLTRGEVVVDLGATPGGWSQVAAKRVGGGGGMVIALDLLEMDRFITWISFRATFARMMSCKQLEEKLENRKVGLVMSDMAPNMSGVPLVDQARIMYLAELGLEFSRVHLKPDGAFLVKVFQGTDYEVFSARCGRLSRQSLCENQMLLVIVVPSFICSVVYCVEVLYKMIFLSLDAVEGEQA
jgi:23S rRNA (uridine2552-2'-O)-methyltransferase